MHAKLNRECVPVGVEAMVKKVVDQMPVLAGEGASEAVSGRGPRGWTVREVYTCALER